MAHDRIIDAMQAAQSVECVRENTDEGLHSFPPKWELMSTGSDDRTVDEKGRITIPKAVRDRFDLEPGEEVSVQVQDGKIVIVPGVSREVFIDRMKGCIDEASASAEPIDPTTLKGIWTEDLPEET
jgi:AbrB family looped-hinge helix DNA binding protein